MLTSLLFCAGLLAQSPPPSARASDRDAYKAAEARAGRDPDALVKLALWCEARGLDAERLRNLARAVLIDPRNATARGLMGLVDYGGRWESPEAVSRKVRADEVMAAKLADYEARRADVLNEVERLLDRKAIDAAVAQYKRASTGYTYDVELYVTKRRAEVAQRRDKAARAHLRLALWCEEKGLKPEAIAHFSEAAQLFPALRTPWEHLGCKKHNGRWMTEEQIAAERRESEAQHHADRTWEPLLRKCRAWLRERSRRDDAEGHLAKITDPRAVPAIWRVLVRGDAADQRIALRLLGQIESPAATRALAGLAVYSEADDVRARAAEALPSRDPRDVITMLVDLLESPLRYKIEPPTTYIDYLRAGRGTLVVEGRDSIFRRTYRGGGAENRIQGTPEWYLREGAIQQQMLADVQEIERGNRLAEQVNGRVVTVLRRVTGQQLDGEEEAWRAWWAEQQGYAYDRSEPQSKPIRFDNLSLAPPVTHAACFAAGTAVQTLSGPQPIESIRLGDRVLAQDIATGVLGYQPVIGIHRNPPHPTLRLTVAGEVIVTTGIHRFWKAGKGWVMARDLKPGDPVRAVGGTARVEVIAPDAVQPVYNLDVARDRDFFVGRSGMLVHDFGPVEAVPEPFDAPSSSAPVARDE